VRTTIVFLGVVVGVAAFAASFGFAGSWLASITFAIFTGALATALFRRFLPMPADEAALPRGLSILSGIATLIALAQLVRLAVFMAEPSHRAFSTIPSSEWEVRHSCLTAYFVASKAAGTDANIYENSLYHMPSDSPSAAPKPRTLGAFRVDVFEYPPPFLLLPRLLMRLAADFLSYRALWFALNVGVVLAAIVLVARFLEGNAASRALALSPLIWASFPTLSLLQKGNAQGIIVALAMAAMVLFERRREPLGGALLAYAILSKLFPGLLLFYLVMERRWRAVAWTGVWCVLLSLLTLVDVGEAPFSAFLHHLPGLVGGESFPALRRPEGLAVNFSVPGLVFKAKLFGVTGSLFGVSKAIGWLYTVVIAGVTIIVARRPTRAEEKPIIWMALLILAMLRSPFLPQGYAAFPPLWLLTLVAAVGIPRLHPLAFVALGWITLNVFWPQDWQVDPRTLAIFNLVPQAATMLLAAVALRRPFVAPKESLPIRETEAP
jgi:hypothetical protein